MKVRIGSGFDVHAFGDPGSAAAVVLGGVRIPHDREILAHSDGDLIIHALCDALLGAAALGDIGAHFPDSDPGFENISSRQLLVKTRELLAGAGYALVNADITIVAETPRIAPFIGEMCANLALDLQTQPGNISIKATTTEGLGFTGRKEGLACQATVLIR